MLLIPISKNGHQWIVVVGISCGTAFVCGGIIGIALKSPSSPWYVKPSKKRARKTRSAVANDLKYTRNDCTKKVLEGDCFYNLLHVHDRRLAACNQKNKKLKVKDQAKREDKSVELKKSKYSNLI